MTPFMIFEGIAVAQFIVAILMFRGLIFKRGTDKQKMPRIGFAIMKTVLTLRSLFKKPERTNCSGLRMWNREFQYPGGENGWR